MDKEEDMVNIRVIVDLVGVMLGIDPEVYKPYSRKDKKGKNMLIPRCLNAIYGTMVASLLYYCKFCKTLLVAGFKLNPYDSCVANWMVDGT